VNSGPLQFDWQLVRDKLLTGMLDTGYDRYVEWYGGRKRRIETSKPTDTGSVATGTAQKKGRRA
jgi:hypothetical protein